MHGAFHQVFQKTVSPVFSSGSFALWSITVPSSSFLFYNRGTLFSLSCDFAGPPVVSVNYTSPHRLLARSCDLPTAC